MLKHFDIRTEKRGKFTMIFRTDFDKIDINVCLMPSR